MTSKIYKITNLINGKIYIGYTKKSLQERFNEHCHPRSKEAKKMPIVNAIKKYGKKNFIIELLEEGENDQYILSERERYWISKFNSRNNNIGYNLAAGGNGAGFCYWNNGKINRRSKDCPGEGWYKGILVSNESRQKRIKSHAGQISSFKGKHHSLEAKKKLSMSHKGIFNGENNPSAKKMEIISPTNKKYIIKGTLENFCKEHNLSYNMARKYKNKCPCPDNKYCSNQRTKNTVGWIFNNIL